MLYNFLWMLTTERKICCALDEQLGRSMLARPIGRQVVEKKGKPLQPGSQDQLIGAGVPRVLGVPDGSYQM